MKKSTYVKKSKSTKGGKKRVYRKKTIPNKTHVFKRLGQTIVLDNGGALGVPELTADGVKQAVLGTAVPSTFFDSNDVGMGIRFKLDSVIDYGDFTQLFDRYKITGVKLDIMYQQSTQYVNPDGSGPLIQPTLYWAYDFDDATPPASADQLTNKSYVRQRVLTANRSSTKVFLKPRLPKAIVTDAGSGLQAINATTERATWIDCGLPGIQHFGLKLWLANMPKGNYVSPEVSHTTCQLRIQPTYYLALRDVQ